MSIQNALDELKDHIEPYVSGYAGTYKNYDGTYIRRNSPHVYTNDLRPPESEESEEEYLDSLYPFVMLNAKSGNVTTSGVDTTENAITVIAVIGVRYPVEDMQGCREVSDLIDRVISSVEENPYTEHCRISPDVSWQIDDGGTHPYYFGALTMTVYDRTATRAEYDI